MNKEQIKAFVESNPKLVSRKSTSLPGVYVLKYKNKVFFRNLWTPELLECRGTVVDENYNIISRPFTKVFNYGENKTRIDRDELCIAPRKVNGFMAALTRYKGDILVSTTGSIDSDFAVLARKRIEELNVNWINNVYTYIFEIVDKSDPHIIKEEEGVYLIGCRENAWKSSLVPEVNLDMMAKRMGANRPEWKIARFSDLVKEMSTCNHEGYMVYGVRSGIVLKLKSNFYLTSKLLSRMKCDKLAQMLDQPAELKQRIKDEEFFPLVDHLVSIRESFSSMNEQDRLDYIKAWLEAG